MNKTYCELTQDGASGESRYAIHISDVELGLISDLLNSVDDPRAVTLRQAVISTIRTHDVFPLYQKTKITSCTQCNRTGRIIRHIDYPDEIKKHQCHHCRGEGQRIAIITKRFEALTPMWKNKLAKEY